MGIMRSAVTSIYLALHCLVSVSYVSATDHIPPETYTVSVSYVSATDHIPPETYTGYW
jgi:hypothetical protein